MGRSLLPITIFVTTYMLAFAALAITRGDHEFIFYTAAMIVMIAAILLIHKRVNFSLPVLWALAIWGLLHLAGGLVPVQSSVLYNLWLIDLGTFAIRYDHAIHAYGFATATWACWQALATAIACHGRCPERLCDTPETPDTRRAVRPTLGLSFAIILMATGLGALNEVIEFAATKLVPDTNVGGYENTAWDLVANLTGATTAATIIYLHARRRAAATESQA